MEEMHVLLKNRGKINPRSSQEYADRGGFEALKKALSMDSEAIIDVIRASGLRGRGGAGFPTYRKMEFTAHASDPTRYMEKGFWACRPVVPPVRSSMPIRSI